MKTQWKPRGALNLAPNLSCSPEYDLTHMILLLPQVREFQECTTIPGLCVAGDSVMHVKHYQPDCSLNSYSSFFLKNSFRFIFMCVCFCICMYKCYACTSVSNVCLVPVVFRREHEIFWN